MSLGATRLSFANTFVFAHDLPRSFAYAHRRTRVRLSLVVDVLYFKNMLSDEELLELMANNLLENEKMKNYIYLDKFGHTTSGV